MTRRELIAGVLPFGATLGCISALAQDARFRTGVTDIHVDAAVTINDQPLLRLTQDDFVIRDEGAVQPVLTFEDASTPLDLVLLLGGAFAKFMRATEPAAARNFMRQMRPKDRVAIISFPIFPQLELPLTSDATKIVDAMNRVTADLTPGGGIKPFLAIWWAIWLLQADARAEGTAGEEVSRRKRAILMLSRASYLDLNDPDDPLIRQLWEMDVSLHAMLFGKYETHPVDLPAANDVFYRIANVRHIAKATGGEAVPDTAKNLPDLLAGIRSSYSLWYRAPQVEAGSLRHITVELSEAAKRKYPGAVVRAREGYFAR